MNFKTKTAAAGILAVLTVAAAAFVILPRHKKLPAPAAVQADKVLVKKAERKLYLQKDGQNLKEYRIALGFAPVGDKLREGDGKTPEGIYAFPAAIRTAVFTCRSGFPTPVRKTGGRRRKKAFPRAATL